METVHSIEAVRKSVTLAKSQDKTVGLVPTMGALHQGHRSLIDRAAKECDFVVVSIFVNPTQFGPSEDFAKYPRTLKADEAICHGAHANLVFAASSEEMYPNPLCTWVNVEKVTENLCGRSRPGHFRGVATVCTKLFNIVGCDKAYFGQKDAQQVAVIKTMVADLNMALEIVVCPIVRKPSGLAISSRNKYLTDEQRNDAAGIYRALEQAKELVRQGVRKSDELKAEIEKMLKKIHGAEVEYVEIVNKETIEPVQSVVDTVLVAVAIKLGDTRLIDNIIIDCPA
jgi:pantoate--beta-alanine ligase